MALTEKSGGCHKIFKVGMMNWFSSCQGNSGIKRLMLLLV